MTTTTTTTTTMADTDTLDYSVPAGLTGTSGRVRCDDCGRWAYLGEAIRHSTRCDTGTLQATELYSAPTLTLAPKNGTVRVLGLASEVVPGLITINGQELVIESVGKTFTRRGHQVRYGYVASQSAAETTTGRRCDECGYTNGHRMDCALQ